MTKSNLEELTIKNDIIFDSESRPIEPMPIGRPAYILLTQEEILGISSERAHIKHKIIESKPKTANAYISSIDFKKRPLPESDDNDQIIVAVQYYRK